MKGDEEKVKLDEFSESLGNRVNENIETSRNFIHVLFSKITEYLKQEDKVSIYQFGTFKKRWVDQRPGINPKTGEEITIESHYRISFSPSSNLSESVNWKYNYIDAYDFPPKETAPMVKKDPEPVHPRETRALIGPEKKSGIMDPVQRRALLAVLFLAVLVVFLSGLLLMLPLDGRGDLQAAERMGEREEEAVEIVRVEETEVEQSEEKPADAMVSSPRELLFRHTVKRGETLVSITEDYWDNKYLWPDMYSNNEEETRDPDVLFPGQIVRIFESLSKGGDLGESEKSALLDDYIHVYNVYRAIGEKNGENRFREARSLLYTATMYDPKVLEHYRDRIREEDYTILSEYIKKNGVFQP